MECLLCGSKRSNEIEYGKMCVIANRAAHFNCLLFSTGLQQTSSTNVEFFGFLFAHVEKQRQKFQKMKCCYCHKTSANICCSKSNCFRSFHFICGIENNARYQFVKPYSSYCNRHVPQPKYRPDYSESCYICFDRIYDKTSVFRAAKMLRAPCCRNGWFHIFCLQKYAQTAGNTFKCPLCNNDDIFKKTMPYWGVYVPDNSPDFLLLQQDRLWPHPCSALICHNLNGRRQDTELNPLSLCEACESDWVHLSCRRYGRSYVLCGRCEAIEEEREFQRIMKIELDKRIEAAWNQYDIGVGALSTWTPSESCCDDKKASTGLQWTSWIANNILSHPFTVLRRQCQVYSTSKSYHILPFTLVPIIIQIYKQQGSAAFWKGFGICLLGRGISWMLNKIIFFLKGVFAPYFSSPVYLLTKWLAAIATVQIDVAALIYTVHSLKAAPIHAVDWKSMLPSKEIICTIFIIEIAKDIIRWFIKTHILFPVPPEVYNWHTGKKEQTFKNQQLEIRSNLITHFVSEALMYPFETILCRLQLQGNHAIIDNLDNGNKTVGIKTKYKNYIDCYEKIMKNEGFNGLYKGFGALVLQFAVQYTVVKIAKWIF